MFWISNVYCILKQSSLPVSPDVLVVQDTDLMELSTAITTFDKWFQLQKIILILLELIFSNDTVEKMAINEKNIKKCNVKKFK